MNTQHPFTLTDGRLLAVSATEADILMELARDPRLFERLGVAPPVSWPPELNDDDSFGYFLKVLQSGPDALTWGPYYLIDLSAGRQLVGLGGFVAPPGEEGVVEIGYSILTPFRRRGFATGLCRMLVGHAFADTRVKHVKANTFPDLISSIGVLTGCGFSLKGGNADGTVTYILAR